MSPLTEPTRLLLRKDYIPIDWEAADYARRVELADGQPLEDGVFNAINAFVIGCKADGIWNAIKASCILAGARTLAGALVPLVGTAPTNVGPFVAEDYNRKTGLVGNGSTKYLDSNRNNNADPQNSKSLAIWISSIGNAPANYIVGGGVQSRISRRGDTTSDLITRINDSGLPFLPGGGLITGFTGISRSQSSIHVTRFSNSYIETSATSQTPLQGNFIVNQTTGRLAFYSIGESLDLALLDARVTTLINAFGAAIP